MEYKTQHIVLELRITGGTRGAAALTHAMMRRIITNGAKQMVTEHIQCHQELLQEVDSQYQRDNALERKHTAVGLAAQYSDSHQE